MMTISEYTQQLGEATGHGWGFLADYGATWLVLTGSAVVAWFL